MPSKNNKIWGETSLIWSGNNTETHKIDILKGGYCSKHKHESKYNLFYVISGDLEIQVWNDNGIIDKTVLKSGEMTVVPPMMYHKFIANENTEAIEIYWVHLKSEDIVREDCGGLIK